MKLWHQDTMELFRLEKQDLCEYLPAEGIDLVPIAKEDLCKMEVFGKQKMRETKSRFRRGDTGLCAMAGSEIVGYGWIKHRGSFDHFYRIGKNVAYLSSFFVREDYRGKGIYPALITHLIQNADNCDVFFISAYTRNKSSLRGLRKVGFQQIRTFRFWRAFKMTLNKRTITNEMR